MNPRDVLLLILTIPIIAPPLFAKRLKVSTYHTVVGMGLCLIDAMLLFLMGGIDVYGTQPKRGTHCPNCGAVVNVPLHMRTKCPYCGNIIGDDQDA